MAQAPERVDFSERPDVLAAKERTRQLVGEGREAYEILRQHHDELRRLLEEFANDQRSGTSADGR